MSDIGATRKPVAGESDLGSTVLDTDDALDEPTDSEVKDYAEFLGLKLPEEKHLLWIARDALQAPIPAPWKPCRDNASSELYYFNFQTGESSWSHPLDDVALRKVAAARRGEAVSPILTTAGHAVDYDSSSTGSGTTTSSHETSVSSHLDSDGHDVGSGDAFTLDSTGVQIPKSGATFVVDGITSVVLDERKLVCHDPTKKEIKEYAKFLGIKLPEEEDLLWIAEAGLTSLLPRPWKPCKTQNGDIYFFNFATGESSWENPLDDAARSTLEKERNKRAAPTAALDLAVRSTVEHNADDVEATSKSSSSSNTLASKSSSARSAEVFELKMNVERLALRLEKVEDELSEARRDLEIIAEQNAKQLSFKLVVCLGVLGVGAGVGVLLWKRSSH